jgi:outer membrane murein-binding lipoprotein Lpp
MRHHRPNLGRFARRLAVCGVASLLLAGCKSTKKYDLIEAELRTRERELADTRAQLDQSRNLLHAYEAAQSRAGPPGPQAPGAYMPVRAIEIGRGTGGVDEDGAPGDEGLMVVIVPRDEDGSAVKAPGRALVAAWEITPAGLKTPIGSWDLPADRLRRTWKSGLISTGYFVAVPWQTLPSTDRVRVAVRFVAADGRAYEADRDVSVRPPYPPRGGNVLPYPQPAPPAPGPPGVPPAPGPPPGGGRQPLFPEMPPPGVPPTIPPGVEELPPPMPSGGERGARLLPPVKP